MKPIYRYKFLRTGYKSEKGNERWKLGIWKTFDGELAMCQSGFHCSKGIYQAFAYIQGEILAKVEVAGKHIIQDYKEVWERMRIVQSWKWTKKDSVQFAIFSARLVLKNYESVFPGDRHPREAIEAAERYVKNPTGKNKSAARNAWDAAWSAAASAAESAAWSAAASAAESAAWSAAASAAWSAAASAAESAAYAAVITGWSAWSAVYRTLEKWMLLHLKKLELIGEGK